MSRRSANRTAFTLTEVIVVIAIATILIALLLPAVQMIRETTRNMSCQNNLRQLAIAALHHESSHSKLPSNGWGWAWLGETSRATGAAQPGGWPYNLLPYIEQKESRALPKTGAPEQQLCSFQPSQFICPSRRANVLSPQLLTIPFRNGETLKITAKTDYAANEGDFISDTDQGPQSLSDGDNPKYAWHDTRNVTGVMFLRSELPLSYIPDGLSHTYLLGEKVVARSAYDSAKDPGFDACLFCGVDWDIARWGIKPPIKDSETAYPRLFGSAHSGGCNFAFVDGSVRRIDYSTDADVHRKASNRADRKRSDN